VILLAAALAPAIFMMHFIYVRDKYEREPIGRLLLVYFLGMLTVVPAAIIESFFLDPEGQSLAAIALIVWLVVALTEETLKYAILRWIALPHACCNEVYDGILYGVAASLGFATTENIFYVLSPEMGGAGTAIMRALLSVPGHALWGVVMGYFAGRAKFAPTLALRNGFLLKGLLLAVFIHGLYDFFAFGAEAAPAHLQLWFLLGVPGTIALSWIVGLALVKRAQQESVFKRPAPMVNPLAALSRRFSFCTNCGRQLKPEQRFCDRCGRAQAG
jgi:protease PrsW